MLTVDDHPLLHLSHFVTEFPAPLGETDSPGWLVAALALDADVPLGRDEDIRKAGRSLLRYGGYRPTGRGKPASEYLVRAAEEQELSSINLAVDACNATSLHSGIPISVVDLDRASLPLRVGIAKKSAHFVFNASGQEIDLTGLLCLFDSKGPCANGVKDAQRTKTNAATRRTLSLLWGHVDHADAVEHAARWYRDALERAGARTDIP